MTHNRDMYNLCEDCRETKLLEKETETEICVQQELLN